MGTGAPTGLVTDDAFRSYYALGLERERLVAGGDRAELVRTFELLERALPEPPARILDIGGGPGEYAARLARLGYDVHVLDVVPLHVEQARERSGSQPDAPFSAELGDALDLVGIADESADAALLLGPLYHLTARHDRVRALLEARRVVRRGGVVAAAAVSRYASLLDGVAHGMLDDPAFAEIVDRDLRDGQHRNPDTVATWFTTAFFHLPDELRAEVVEAGLVVERLVGVEGPAAWFRAWPDERDRILETARRLEHLPALSSHMLCTARRG